MEVQCRSSAILKEVVATYRIPSPSTQGNYLIRQVNPRLQDQKNQQNQMYFLKLLETHHLHQESISTSFQSQDKNSIKTLTVQTMDRSTLL